MVDAPWFYPSGLYAASPEGECFAPRVSQKKIVYAPNPLTAPYSAHTL